MMYTKGVLLVNETGTIRGSGILFKDGWILTHGSILRSAVNSSKDWLQRLLQHVDDEQPVDQVTFYVHFDDEEGCRQAKVEHAWKCPLVHRSLASLFADWTFGDNTKPQDDISMMKKLCSVFILLKMRHGPDRQYRVQDWVNGIQLTRGMEVQIESTPYGSEIFLNSISEGIVCNTFGEQDCLFLTDAGSVIGCEGAPVFSVTRNGRALIGMVGCSLSWSRGEWVGFTIAINLTPVLTRLMETETRATIMSTPSLVDDIGLIDECVVLIRCGNLWGSGAVVDEESGTILTCSHVLAQVKDEPIKVVHKGNTYSAQLVYRTPDGLAYDVAVVQVKSHRFCRRVEFAEEIPPAGSKVYAAGFPLLCERDNKHLLPTLAEGCVSKSTDSILLQTTCCIQSGSSGGAIFRQGRLLGLVVSNARDASTGGLYPHVNFSIPSTVLVEPITRYIKTKNKQHLEMFKSDSPYVQTLWKLQKPTSKL